MNARIPNETLVADELVRQALLYAAGELEAAEADAFERRLGGEPAAQEALIDAVQLAALLGGPRASPSTDRRSAVRDRCLPRPRAGRHFFRAAGLGLVATLLLSVAADPSSRIGESESPLEFDGARLARGSDAAAETANAGDDDEMLETALEWAELSNCGDHLQRTWDDEARRRARDRERRPNGLDASAWDGMISPAGQNE